MAKRETRSGRVFHKNARQIVGVGLISAAAISPQPGVAALIACIGVLAIAGWVFESDSDDIGRPEIWAGVVGAGIVLLVQYRAISLWQVMPIGLRQVWALLAVTACAFLALSDRSLLLKRMAVALALASALVITGGVIAFAWGAEGGVDVYLMHQTAGDALVTGANPYGDAVEVPDGNPFSPEGSTIVGYPYPPVVLLTYGLTGAVSDSRLVSAIAWLAILTWLAIRARPSSDLSGTKASVLLLVATAPAWPAVWLAGWTDPLSLALLLMAAIMWEKNLIWSAVLLGLALASRQYLVFLIPLLLLMDDERRWQRVGVTLATGVVTLLPPLVIDAPAFINATVLNLANIGFRPDTQSLSGLLYSLGIELALPTVVWIAVSLVFAALVGRGAKGAAGFFSRGALALGFSLLIGQATNPNYWFMVMGIAAIGAVLSGAETSRDPETSYVSSPAISGHSRLDP